MMLRHNESRPKNQDRDAVDGADLAVRLIASRFNLPLNIARVVCEQARIGGGDHRPSSGGRTA
jgi:hypothetical protein